MAVFVVAYDVPRRAHPGLSDQLTRLGAVRAMASVWLLDWHGTAAQVRDLLSTSNSDHFIFVAELTDNAMWAGSGMMPPSPTWLLQRVRRLDPRARSASSDDDGA